jgi:predicted O-methyltransferase YrrM
MYSRLQLAKKYIRYYFTASNGKGHGIHSPFIFDFVVNVLNDNRHFYPYDAIESLRSQLLNDKSVLTIEDFGAGSATGSTKQRTVASIAKHAAKNKRLCRLLFRLVDYYQPRSILELGTSLGISSAYMASAAPGTKLITIEGASSVARAAAEHHQRLQLYNIHVIAGRFEDTLPGVLHEMKTVDMAFVDGNHRFDPTKYYFDQIVTKVTPGSILIFDDIHWSKEMEDVWRVIKADERVVASIDLFFMGIVLFNPAFKSKQHFTIRF